MLRIFSVGISMSPHVCFILDLMLISMLLRYCSYGLGIFHANQTTIAGRPNAALLFWFFGDFRCGVSLFMVILVIYIYIYIYIYI